MKSGSSFPLCSMEEAKKKLMAAVAARDDILREFPPVPPAGNA